jgi:alkanesulfonate monooxygenase SsuD/methylene tetrahydromethanopterin reductase-like flavin-dependent oxidoreductase (luciferase family)
VVRDTEAEIRALADAGRIGSAWREPFESWAAGNLIGTPEQVADKIRTYIGLGCRGFVPWCSDYPDHTTLRLFAETVIPEFRSA